MKKLSEIKSIDDLEIPDNLEELMKESAKRKMSKEERRSRQYPGLLACPPTR